MMGIDDGVVYRIGFAHHITVQVRHARFTGREEVQGQCGDSGQQQQTHTYIHTYNTYNTSKRSLS